MTQQFIPTSKGQVYVRYSQDKTLPPLFLLHQTASSSAMYQALIPLLADRFWVIAPDMIGFGQSVTTAPPVPSISFHAAVFWEVADYFAIKRCALFGHHTGASVAVQMTHDQPDKVTNLLLSGPPLLTKTQIDTLRQGIRPIEPDPSGDFLQVTWNRLRQKSRQAPLSLTLRETLLTIKAGNHYPAAYEAVFHHPMPQQLASLTCPVLLMAGEHDSLIDSLVPAANSLPKSLPRQIHQLSNAGGYICDEQPELVAQLILTFLMEKES